MGKYTARLQEFCEYFYYNSKKPENNINVIANYNVSEGNEWVNPFNKELVNPFTLSTNPEVIIKDVRSIIFDFEYPKYNDKQKEELEVKILKHFYMHEIGFETWARFKIALNERLNLIMPYYVDMYKTIDMQGDNPLVNTEYYETKDTQSKGNSNRDNTEESTTHTTTNSSGNTNTTSDGTSKEVLQDTPTSELGNTDYATTIKTTKNDNVDDTNVSSETTGDTTTNGNSNTQVTNDNDEKMQRHITGLMAYSKQDMIRSYRDNILNIDESIIRELYDLFMLIY